jgi:hypothetical protein
MEKVKLKKQRSKFLFCIISFVLAGCSSTTNQEYFNKTMGLNIEIKKKIFNSEDSISPQGEGFSMEIITFNKKETDSLFVNNDSYPKSYDLRSDWKISKWQKTPIVNKDVFELLFNYDINDTAIKKELANLKHLMSSNDNYISYYFKESDGNIYAIDICVLDIKNKKIYLCEIIT